MHVINFDWTDLGRPTRRGKCEDKQTDFPSTRGVPLQGQMVIATGWCRVELLIMDSYL